MNTLDTHAAESVDNLADRIATLVLERQSLRAASAESTTLEENRVELVRLQQLLTHAFGREAEARAA